MGDANYVDVWRLNTLKQLQESYKKKTAGSNKLFYKVLKSVTLMQSEDEE